MRHAGIFVTFAVALSIANAPRVFAGNDGRIGVYTDAAATRTEATFEIGVPQTLYIIATLAGQSAEGITVAEFRVTGMPDDWLVQATPNPNANVVLGDPFRPQEDIHRALIAFEFCERGNEQSILLYTVVVTAKSAIAPTEFAVEGGDPPTNAAFPTALITRCDPPLFTKVPVEGGRFAAHMRPPQDLDYSALSGYDADRGVVPQHGLSGDRFQFRVTYADSSGALPMTGSPRLELDANGDGDVLDPFEGTFVCSQADLDSTLSNGKDYRFDVALAAPPGGRYRYRFSAVSSTGELARGRATQWNDSLFVGGPPVNLAVRAEYIRVAQPVQLIDDAHVYIPVENRSDTAVSNVLVVLEDVYGVEITQRTLSTIGPRSIAEIALTWNLAGTDFQAVIVRVDPTDEIAESNEEDNVASQGIVVADGNVPFELTGLPALNSVPPVATLVVSGHAQYATGPVPRLSVSNARVVARPSWAPDSVGRSNAEGDFEFLVTAPGLPGAYSLDIIIEDGSDSQSQTIPVQVTTGTDAPEVHAANLVTHIATQLDAGCPATQVTVTWSISNIGDRSAAASTARLLHGTTVLATDVPVPAILSGHSVQLTPITFPIEPSALHGLTAHADAGNSVRELREDDNDAIVRVRSQAGCLDLALVRVQVEDGLCADSSMTLRVDVENRSCTTTQPARVAARTSTGEIASVALSALAPGETAILAIAPQFAAGWHDFEVVLDPEGDAGADCDLASNVLGAAVHAEPCPVYTPPDFAVLSCDIEVSDTTPEPGQPVQFSAWVSNVTNGNATLPAHVRFELDGVPLGPSVPVGLLLAHERVLATAAVTWPFHFGAHDLSVVVDPGAQPESGTPGNNSATRPAFDLAFGWIPNCLGSSGMFSNCTPCMFDSFEVRVVVRNLGLFTPPPVRIEYRVDQTGPVLGTAEIVVPAGCASTPRKPSIRTAFATAGTRSIWAILDPDNAVPESIEGDLYEGSITVLPCITPPDLVTAILFPDVPPPPGSTVTEVEVRVTNSGAGNAWGVDASLSLDGETLCDSLPFGDIGPGQSVSRWCSTPWVVAMEPCAQRLEACADPTNRIAESNEFNNCRISAVGNEVSDLAFDQYLIDVSPPAPVPSETITITIGMRSLYGIETTGRVAIDWAPLESDDWVHLGTADLHIPPIAGVHSNVASAKIQVPVAQARLRFTLSDVCPMDPVLENNVLFGFLPWTVTAVTVSDLSIASTEAGVRIRWTAGSGATSFAFERRVFDRGEWQRLLDVVPAEATIATRNYEFIDRTAPAGERLQYRLLVHEEGGVETVAGMLEVMHALPALRSHLESISPQPFRSGGRIAFALRDAGPVDLSVYDTAGRRIAVLRRAALGAGRHAVTWDGRDSSGRQVPAGVYFCRFATAGIEQSRRIVLVQ